MAADSKGNWIGSAIKHPGALHRDLHVAMGETIPAKKMAEAKSGKLGSKVQKRANFAQELKGFNHK